MRSPAAAIAWEFRQQHRWALIGLAGYVLFAAAFKIVILGTDTTVELGDGRATAVTVPLSMLFLYFLAVFSFGLTGDLAARQSIYPARLFTLPVTTSALAGLPMLYGTAAMTTLWLATALLARWPWGIEVPQIWPGVLAAAFLAWTQALTWMPYGLRGLRVMFAVLWLMTLDAIVILAIYYEVSEPMMIAFLAPQLPLAYLVARYAVTRARRGVVPDWGLGFGRVADGAPRRQDHFSSPARAQLWFEWRRHGRSLPIMVAILLPFEFALLLIPGNDTPRLVLYVLIAALVTPPVMAGFAAATVSKANPHARDSYGVSPFTATRPLTSAALIAAKLQMAIGSTFAAWLLVLIAIPLGLILSGTWQMVIDRTRHGMEVIGTLRVIVLALLVLGLLMASTWKKLVQSLYIGLTGREWIVKTNGFVALSFLVIIGPLLQWIHDDRDLQAWLWDRWQWLLVVLIVLKMSAAVWIATRLYRSRLLSDRTLVTGAASWLAAVLALYGLLVWWIDTPLIAHYVLALFAILAIPLARLSAAPLALAWNRHR